MKLAVTAKGTGWDAAVDPRFGRAAYFVLVEMESGECTALDNKANLNADQGAGIQAAKRVSELGVQAVLTGHVGPKACSALQAAGVEVYMGATGRVSGAVAQYMGGVLRRVDSPEFETYWR